MGKVLWVDLATRTATEERLREEIYRNYLGGYGLGVKLLYARMAPGADPLGPSNILGFVPGLLTGTGTPFSGRFSVVCKSPLTGGWGDANCGGFFGPELRRCGYDGLFITGESPEPVYLSIHKGRVEFHCAGHLWGGDAATCEGALKERHGRSWQVAVIGQAGENLVRFAGIVNDNGRLAARSGVGAVMGSKRLKAVIVKGHLPVPRADIVAFKRSTEMIMVRLRATEPDPKHPVDKWLGKLLPPKFAKWLARVHNFSIPFPHPTVVWSLANQGTTSFVAFATEGGDCPVKNWAGVGMRDFPFQQAKRISDDQAVQFNTRLYACSACPLHCGAEVKVEDPEYGIDHGHRTEFESLAGLGANLLIDRLKAVQFGHHLCNQYGLDVISTGAVLGFAFECYEKGLITRKETGGVALQWGDHTAMLAMIHQIARREHIGGLLAEGVMRAAARIGRGAEAWAIHVGGQELPFHDPRLTPSYGTTYLTDPTPGRHTAGGAYVQEDTYGRVPFPVDVPRVRRFDYRGKGEAQAVMVKTKQVQQAVGLCEFSDHIGTFPYEVMLKGACGWELSSEELLTIGERIQALRQAFNCREGIRPGNWRLPDRVAGRPPLPAGPTAGITIDEGAMALSYYRAMGYDPDSGRPAAARLRALGLGEVARDLWGREAGAAPGAPTADRPPESPHV